MRNLGLLERADEVQPVRTIEHQSNVGQVGSVSKERSKMIETLALGGSTAAEVVDPKLLKLVYGLSFMVWNEHLHRQLLDRRWCEAFAGASQQASAAAGRSACVLGLGSAVAALAAGRAGCTVLWLERVARFRDFATQLVARNGLEGRIQTQRVRRWSDAVHAGPPTSAPRFDTVITEEVQ